MKIMMPRNDIKYVVGIQDYGEPLVALYVDVLSRQLYLMVRVNADSDEPEYGVTYVDADDIDSYVKEEKTLSQILGARKFWSVVFHEGKMSISDTPIPDLKESIEDMDEYIAEDCEDEFWLRTFLNRVRYGKPLGIGNEHELVAVPVRFINANMRNTENYGY